MWCAPSRRFARGRTAYIDTVSGFKLLLVLTGAPLARLGYERTVAGMLIMASGGNDSLDYDEWSAGPGLSANAAD
jgi:hypothetical protein